MTLLIMVIFTVLFEKLLRQEEARDNQFFFQNVQDN